ncbi:tumor necrosis factor receptor superfamily member 1B-like [Lampetra planeri]
MAELGRKRQEPQVDPVTSVPSVNHTLAKGKQWQPKIILIQCWDLPHCKLKRRERLLFLLVVTMLSDAAKVPHACNLSTQYERNGLCCDRCRPGHHRVSWCDANAPTVCAPCPQGRFNPDFNTLHSCNFCKLCNTGFRQVEQEGCTPNHNSRCGCGNGTYEVRIPKDGSLFWCCPHCPAGHELAKQCHYRDFISSCAPCPPGSFSDGSGSPCRNHTRCEVVKQPPTNTSDAVCADPTDNKDGSSDITLWASIAAVVVLLILLALGISLWILKRKIATTEDPQNRELFLEGRDKNGSARNYFINCIGHNES